MRVWKTRMQIIAICAIAACTTGCVGMVIDQTVDATIAVAKVPFKVGAAVVDVAIPDGDDDKEDD